MNFKYFFLQYHPTSSDRHKNLWSTRVNSDCTCNGRTAHRDCYSEKKINRNKKESLEGLLEHNEVSRQTENISGQKEFREPDDSQTLLAKLLKLTGSMKISTSSRTSIKKKKKDALIVIGEWNEKVGSQQIYRITGNFGF